MILIIIIVNYANKVSEGPMFKMTRTAAAAALFCAASTTAIAQGQADDPDFEQDREAILAMAGNYDVTFDFRETVVLTEGYELKEPKRSGGYEIVRVIEDTGDFISLQHILVVGEEGEEFPIKHWRQDWTYEPAEVLTFIGGNAWEMRAVPEDARDGAWAQEVYQVDDAPRYGAVGEWDHDNNVSQWTPPAEWRPLPRRDMTTRDDYDAVLAVNRHTVTPFGWVHEQNNSKLSLQGEPRVLVREIGLNTYRLDDGFPAEVGDSYWAATKDYWAGVRGKWEAIEAAGKPFGLTMQGEPEPLYQPLLALAGEVKEGKTTAEAAIAEAEQVIDKYTTTEIGTLEERIAKAHTPKEDSNNPAEEG